MPAGLIGAAGPAGFVPLLALFHFTAQDGAGRSVAVTTLLSFGVVAVPAFAGLRHFVPMMLLPIAVFWRLLMKVGSGRGLLVGAYVLASLISFGLALPPRFDIDRDIRDIGRLILASGGGFGGPDDPRHRAVVVIADAGARTLFTPDWYVPDASLDLVTGAQFIYYARQGAMAEGDDPLVVIQASAAPDDALSVSGGAGSTIFVLDTLEERVVRRTPRERGFQSPLYRVPQATLRQYIGESAGNCDTSPSNWPLVWRLVQT